MKPKIKAWLYQLETGQLKADGARILYYIKRQPYCTIREISDRLNIMYSTVSARVSDLMDAGLVEEDGRMKRSKYTYLKFQPIPEKQKQNADNRKKEKAKQWRNNGIHKFADILPESLKKELELLTF